MVVLRKRGAEDWGDETTPTINRVDELRAREKGLRLLSAVTYARTDQVFTPAPLESEEFDVGGIYTQIQTV